MKFHCSKINSDTFRELVHAECGFRCLVRGFLANYDEPIRSHVVCLTKAICSEYSEQLDDLPPSVSTTLTHQLQTDGARAYWRQTYANRRESILHR